MFYIWMFAGLVIFMLTGNHLIDGFVSSLRRAPDAPALHIDDTELTYGELAEAAQKISHCLNDLQRREVLSQRCILLGNRTAAQYAALLGISMSNMAYVPLNAHFPVVRNLSILEQAQASILIVDSACTFLLEDIASAINKPLHIIFADSDVFPGWTDRLSQHNYYLPADRCLEACPREHNEDNEAYVLFTSGTTGTPKGIAISHKNVCAYLDNIADLFPFKSDDRCTQLFELTFDLSVHDLFACWQAGACLYVPSSEALLFPAAYIKQHQISVWFSVPSVANLMRDYGVLRDGELPSLRISLFCGEALSIDVAMDWQRSAPDSVVANMYGPTEATIAITYFSVKSLKEEGSLPVMPIGNIFPQHDFVVIDENLEPVKKGEKGELMLAGPQLSPGYINNAVANRSQFIQKKFDHSPFTRWYRTGDIVSVDNRYGLLYHGRLDKQIKIRGYRVELLEVENVVQQVSGFNQVAVVSHIDKAGSQMLVAYIVAGQLNKKHIIEGVAKKLPDYMHINDVQVLDEMPLNANGKTDYKVLETFITS